MVRCWHWRTASLVAVTCTHTCTCIRPEWELVSSRWPLTRTKTATTAGSSRSSTDPCRAGTAPIPSNSCATATWSVWNTGPLVVICTRTRNRLPFPANTSKLPATERYLTQELTCHFNFNDLEMDTERNWRRQRRVARGDRRRPGEWNSWNSAPSLQVGALLAELCPHHHQEATA